MTIDKPIYENITEYIITDGTYEMHLDFAGAITHGKVGNPIHFRLGNIIKININGMDIDFKDNPDSVAYLKRHIDIVL